MGRDLEKELKAWDGEWPEAWRPREGDILTGRVIRYGEGQSQFGPVRTVILQKDDGSRVSIWLSSTVLLAEWKRVAPRVGERVGVRFVGVHPEKRYKRYVVIADRDESETPSFEPLGGERGADLEPDDLDEPRDPFAEEPELESTPYAASVLRPPARPSYGRN